MPSPKSQELTDRQRRVFNFIVEHQRRTGLPPTLREVQRGLGMSSQNSAVQFVQALKKKGVLQTLPGTARGIVPNVPALRPAAKRSDGRPLFIDVPLRGDIQAGLAVDAFPQTEVTLPVYAESMGLTERSQPFALRARGTSMIGKGILDGDYIVLDAAREAQSGDVVAALLDGESTLKTLVKRGQRTFLKAENPEFGVMKPTRDLQVQGVMVGLIRGKP